MNPQEKARQLVDMHINPFKLKGCSHPIHTLFESTAKQCALNTVDEMMLVLPYTDINTTLGKFCIKQHEYLIQVRHEIKKL